MKREIVSREHSNIVYRSRVPWGWIVESVDEVMTFMHDQQQNGYEWRTSICFVFDPFHWWKL